MSNPYGAAEISVQDVAAKVKAGEQFVWLDVREPNELSAAAIANELVVNVPMSELAQKQIAALPPNAEDKDAEIVVFCHHGMRSRTAAERFLREGFKEVYNLEGGIEAWSQKVDPKVPRY